MLFDEDILVALEKAANKPERTRSSFWETELEDFSFTAKGEMTGLICVGSISKKYSQIHKAAHWLLQWPYRYIVRKSQNFGECYDLAKFIAEGQERAVTLDMVRQTLGLAVIKDNLDVKGLEGINLVIGDGYGVMTSLLKLSYSETKIVTVNLTTPLLMDLVYARKAIPSLRIALPTNQVEMMDALNQNDIDVIAIQADNSKLIAEANVGLAFALHSMQEMTNSVIKSYFDLLRGNKNDRTAFYCLNRIYKQLYDGEEIKFFDFPWSLNDTVLFDEVCRWDNFEYNSRPPFWSRNPNQKQHRLVILEKLR